MVVDFRIQGVVEYPKSEYRARKIYGDTADAALLLIICRKFDASAGSDEDNIVVYASPMSLHHAE